MTQSVSIVIPVRNEASGIRQCLDSWLQQTVDVREIVVIDSGSDDGTTDICREYEKVELVEIPGSEFNHGTTRNRAMQHVTGDLTLMTVGDAKAADDRVLERLRDGFDSPDVAGVCGFQIVAHETDKNPVEWFRPQSQPQSRRYAFRSPDEFEALSAAEKKAAASWDDVVAMYRTSVLRDEIPFREITYGEDPMWAIDALKAGHTLVYNPEARVYHYHLENGDVTYKRAVTMLCLRNRLFGDVPDCPTAGFRFYASVARTLLKEKALSVRERVRWFRFNHTHRKALKRAVRDFLKALRSGETAVQSLHERCVGKPFKVTS